MNSSKFSVTALMIVVAVFSALTFIFTVKIVNLNNPFPVNEFYEIEGTKYGVRYSTLEPNGIYKGIKSACTLVLEGSYGSDWGLYREGDTLYVNEYVSSDMGLLFCKVVKIDLNTFEKETLLQDALLRGTCASGELVCVSGITLDSNMPAENSLCKLYAMSSNEMRPEGKSAVIYYIDPKTGEVLASFRDDEAMSDDFEARYLERTYAEVAK